MSIELEREYTFLLDKLPDDLDGFPSKIIDDIFIPVDVHHPVIRIRRNGDRLMITKKYPDGMAEDDAGGDSSHMIEHTIPLSRLEYDALASLPGKRFKKRRFTYRVNGYDAELDVYLDKLAGLATVDFEFNSDEAMKKFVKPVFAGADITHDETLAGGMLCGKSYVDLAPYLAKKYGHKPLENVEKYEEEA
jgi:CYTH domain-containing protein